MTSNACQNVFYGAETSINSYSVVSTIGAPHIHHTCCCCDTHQQQHHQHHHQNFHNELLHDDLQINNNNNAAGGGGVRGDPSTAIALPDNASFSLSTTSNGSVVVSSRRLCECDQKGVRKKRKKKKDEGMKLKRLLLLIVIFTLYVSIGAAVFNALEAGAEQERKDELQNYVEVFLDTHPCVNRTALYELLKKAVVDSEIVYYVVENKTHLDRWDFSGAFGFVVSVVTTIGFGNLAPFTMEGKSVCVVYSVFGIPLTLLVLGGIGEKMANCVSKVRKCRNPYCHHSTKVNRMLNILYVMIMGVAIIFLAPAAMFTYVEQWHFLESLYFCYTTLSTIGFGDYVIGIHETRFSNVYAHEFYEVFAYVWILVGLAYLSLVYRYITDTMVANAQKVERKTIKRLGPELNKSFSTLLSPTAASNPEVTLPEPSTVTAAPPTSPNDTVSAPADDEEEGDREQSSSHNRLLCESVQLVPVGGRSRNRLSVS